MPIDMQPIIKRSVSDELAGHLRDAIIAGDLISGENLPPERKLAEQFSVNRSSVREALRRLESWGLVTVEHGAGVRVTDFLASAGLHILPFMLAPRGQVDRALLGDLFDLRAELLAWTAERAAQRCDVVDIDRLAQILTQLDATDDVATLQNLDYQFFSQLVQMSKNRLLLLISNVVREVYEHHHELFRMLYSTGLDTSHHHKALKAIRQGNALAARRAMHTYGLQASAQIA